MRGLTRRYYLATTAVMAAMLALLGALQYLEARGFIGEAPLRFGLLGAGVTAWLVVLALTRAFAQSLLAPLRAMATELRALGLDGELATSGEAVPEVRELAAAFDGLRARLRASTISRDYLDRLLASMSEAILVTDVQGRIYRVNDAACGLLQYGPQELLGRPLTDVLKSGATDVLAQKPSRSATPRESTFRRRDGEPIYLSYTVSEIRDEHGAVESRVYAAQDIAERKRVEQRIRYLARVDPLTKLANRMQFQHQLQQAIARARRTRQYLAILYFDVDRFKDINDTFGHAAGDTTLETFSRRIVAELAEEAVAGRLAGDEFAVLLSGFDDIDRLVAEVSAIADRLLRAVGAPFEVRGEEIFMTTSMGIALYPRDGDNVIDLIRNADAALYRAKRAGGNCFELYTPEMNTAAVERLMLKSRLRRAFERDELRLHYQPKYNLKNGRIEGAEALIRWNMPERGLVYPSDFIPLAEETNLILQVGDWVLNRVCADYRLWQRSVPSPCRVSVNLSLRQLHQQRFLDRVRNTFMAHGVSPTCLELEITETTLMEDTHRTIRILDALYGMGLHLAIDDFGTGYSSLSALQQFPISTLKIDQSFVRGLKADRDNAAIVAAIIRMAHSLRLEVVAEGVESAEQLEFLREHGCDYAQGHLFGDHMTGEAFGALLVEESAGAGKHDALFA
jgi:diguanylate cyclase (GGDEF)-like protein/PAS domain S-box-containing protein